MHLYTYTFVQVPDINIYSGCKNKILWIDECFKL